MAAPVTAQMVIDVFQCACSTMDLGDSIATGLRQKFAARVRAQPDQWIEKLLIYTDGSGILTKQWPLKPVSAGWAFTIAGRCAVTGNIVHIGDAYGPVVPGGRWKARRPTNSMGELQAIAEVLSSAASMQVPVAIEIHSDSKYVLDLLGGSTASTEVAAVSALRSAFAAAQRACSIETFHVYSHQGIVANEWADVLANRGTKGKVWPHHRQPNVDLDTVRAAKPAFSLYEALFWTSVLPDDFAEPGIRKADVFSQYIDATTGLAEPGFCKADGEELGHAALRCASFNVQTLCPAEEQQANEWTPSVKRRMLARQLAEASVAICGVQEGRSREQRADVCEEYLMVKSAAQRGQWGCEIWFHSKLGLNSSSVMLLHSSPRRLVVACSIHGTQCIVASFHAPVHVPGEQHQLDIAAWWAETQAMLRQVVPASSHMILCCDLNAEVRRHDDVADVILNEAASTTGFAALCEEWRISAPAASQPDKPPPSREKKCIDIVAAPEHWLIAQAKQETLWQILSTTSGAEDHRPVCIQCFVPRAKGKVQREPQVNRANLRSAPFKQMSRDWWSSAPPIPEAWSADLQRQAIAQAVRNLQQTSAGKAAMGPRKPWIDETLWQIMEPILAARRERFRLRRQVKAQLLRFSFSAWASAVQSIAPPSQSSRRQKLAASRLQQAWLREFEEQQRPALKEALQRAKGLWANRQAVAAAEQAEAGSSSAAWRFVKQLRGKVAQRQPAVLQDKQGKVATSKAEAAEVWFEKFQDEFLGRVVVMSAQDYKEWLSQSISLLPPAVPAPTPQEEEIATILGKLPVCKARGTDDVFYESLRASPSELAPFLARLFAKVVASNAPEQWRGGTMMPVPRKPKLPFSGDNARGVLIAAGLGRVYSRWLRAQALPYFQLAAAPEQFGGLPGMGIDFGQQMLSLLRQQAAQTSKSVATLFVDFKAAYYSAYVDTLLGPLTPASARGAAPVDDGFDIAPPAATLLEWGMPNWIARAMQDWHAGSWFTVPHLQPEGLRACTTAGVRPGDPPADMVFNFVMAAILHEVREELGSMGALVRLQRTSEAFSTGIDCPDLMGPVWVDDQAIVIEADTPDEIIALLPRVTAVVTRCSRRRGLKVNLDPGKTEALLELRGPGARAAKARLKWQGQQASLEVGADRPLRVVRHYKHLGSVTARRADFARRRGLAQAVVAAVGRRILGNRVFAQPTRVAIFGAVLDGVLLNACGHWMPLDSRDLELLSPPRTRAIYLLAGVLPGPGGPTLDETRASLGIPSIQQKLQAARLKYVGRLARRSPMALDVLMDTEAASPWITAIIQDIDEIRNDEPALETMPPPHEQLCTWLRLFAEHPAAWQNIVRKWTKKRASSEVNPDSVLPGFPVLVEQHHCYDCGLCFSSRKSLVSHARLAHGHESEVRKRVGSTSICPVCGTNFWTRPRLIRHFSSSGRCHIRLTQSIPPIPEADFILAEEESRAAWRLARAEGSHVLAAFRPASRPDDDQIVLACL